LNDSDLAESFAAGRDVGILLGEASQGLVDIDLDTDEAATLATEFLPATEMWSGHGRRPRTHAWYRVLDRVPPSRRFLDADGRTVLFELRSSGCQTVVPPSRHPNGDSYEWYGPLEPGAVCCDNFEKAVSQLHVAAVLAKNWPSSNGSRHDISMSLAGALVRLGWTAPDVEHLVSVVARVAGDQEVVDRARAVRDTANRLAARRAVTGIPTLSRLLGAQVVDHLLRIVQAARPGEPWDQPISFRKAEVPDFPVHVLPVWLRDYVAALAEMTQTPLALAGGAALGVCAVAIARKFRVLIRPGWEEPTNLFIVVVLLPAERKSAVLTRVVRPLIQWECDQRERVADAMRDAEAKRTIHEARFKEATKKAAKARPEKREEAERAALECKRELEELVVPVPPRLFGDDITTEKLVSVIQQHGGRFAVISTEGGIFEILAGRYHGDKGPVLDVFLKGHAGDPIRVDRVNRAEERIDQPTLTVILTIQPDVLKALADKPGFRGRGLLARFLYAIPKSCLGTREQGAPPIPPEIEQLFARSVRRLIDQAGRPDGQPWMLALSDEAEYEIRCFETDLEPRLHRSAELGSISDWAGKLAGGVARLAAILHMAEYAQHPQPSTIPISVETMRAAIVLGRFYLEHAVAAFASMRTDSEVEDAVYLWDWIRRSGANEFSMRDAYQGTRGRFQRVKDLRPCLDLLVDHNYIRERQTAVTGRAGRPRGAQYDVNPLAGDFEDFEKDSPIAQKKQPFSQHETPPVENSDLGAFEVPTQNPQNPDADTLVL
jgi:hypothetical protein